MCDHVEVGIMLANFGIVYWIYFADDIKWKKLKQPIRSSVAAGKIIRFCGFKMLSASASNWIQERSKMPSATSTNVRRRSVLSPSVTHPQRKVDKRHRFPCKIHQLGYFMAHDNMRTGLVVLNQFITSFPRVNNFFCLRRPWHTVAPMPYTIETACKKFCFYTCVMSHIAEKKLRDF